MSEVGFAVGAVELIIFVDDGEDAFFADGVSAAEYSWKSVVLVEQFIADDALKVIVGYLG